MLVNITEIVKHHVQFLGFCILSLSVGISLCKDKHSRYITITTTWSKELDHKRKLIVNKLKLCQS